MDGQENDKEVKDAGQGSVQDKTTDVTVESKQEDISEKVERMNAKLKKVMSNFDRVNTELQKTKEERDSLVKERMTEKERAEFELKKREDRLKEKEAEIEREKLRNVKLKLMSENQLDSRLEEYISGADESAVKLSIFGLVKIIEEETAKRVNEKLGSGEKPPSGAGKPVETDLSKQYDEALKAGNFVLATKLAGQIKPK